MNVNLKGAANNCYLGLQKISEILEKESYEFSSVQNLIDELNDVCVDYQPRLGAYCLKEHFDSEQEEKNEQTNKK